MPREGERVVIGEQSIRLGNVNREGKKEGNLSNDKNERGRTAGEQTFI